MMLSQFYREVSVFPSGKKIVVLLKRVINFKYYLFQITANKSIKVHAPDKEMLTIG